MPAPRPPVAAADAADAVRVRAARPDDAPACARILRASRAAAMPWLPVLHTPEEDLAHLTGVLTRQPAWVAEIAAGVADEAVAGAAGDVVGFAVLDPVEGVLDHLYLAPDARRRGIGSALLATVRAAYDGPLELWVFEGNTDARAFYAAHGGVDLYATDGAANEERTPDVRMRLPAAAAPPDEGGRPGQ